MNAYFFIQGKINFQFCKHRIHTSYNIKIATLRCVLALCWSYLSLPDQPVGGTVCVRKEGRFMAIATEQI